MPATTPLVVAAALVFFYHSIFLGRNCDNLIPRNRGPYAFTLNDENNVCEPSSSADQEFYDKNGALFCEDYQTCLW